MSYAQANGILENVCTFMGQSPEKVRGPWRTKELTVVRRVCATLLRRQGASYPEIGMVLGGRHHTTIMSLLGALPNKRPKGSPERHFLGGK